MGYPLGCVAVNHLCKNRRVLLNFEFTDRGHVVDTLSISSRSYLKRRVLAYLKESGDISVNEIKKISPGATRILKQFVKLGWVEAVASTLSSASELSLGPELTKEQKSVVDEISAESNQFNCWLLHGVTGSGKTEVYLQLVALKLLQGKQTLVLIPEISLTPQLETVFHTRFPDTSIISLHSGLSSIERANGWLQALEGKAQIILGTRLAVFTPIPNLGLIIVDEEQDSSFKQKVDYATQHEMLLFFVLNIQIFP